MKRLRTTIILSIRDSSSNTGVFKNTPELIIYLSVSHLIQPKVKGGLFKRLFSPSSSKHHSEPQDDGKGLRFLGHHSVPALCFTSSNISKGYKRIKVIFLEFFSSSLIQNSPMLTSYAWVLQLLPGLIASLSGYVQKFPPWWIPHLPTSDVWPLGKTVTCIMHKLHVGINHMSGSLSHIHRLPWEPLQRRHHLSKHVKGWGGGNLGGINPTKKFSLFAWHRIYIYCALQANLHKCLSYTIITTLLA